MACSPSLAPACMPSNSLEEFDHPTHPSTNSPPDNGTSSRNYLKCPQCRRDRKSCLRDSTDPNQRCTRCRDLGHPCGPSIRAINRRRRRFSNMSENMNTPSGVNSSSLTSAAEITQPLEQTTTTIRYWALGSGADFGRVSYTVAVNTALQRLFARARFDLETCMTFERAATSTRILPTQSQYLCQELRARISHQLANLQFNQLYGVNVPQTRHRPSSSTLSAEMAQSVDPASGDFITLVSTANVLNTCRPVGLQCQGHSRNSVNELPQSYYISSEAAFKEYTSSISQDASGQSSVPYYQAIHDHGPFPASHLAYLNLDRESAYQLWQNTVDEGIIVDILGRSFPHIVAEAGDSNLLERMSARVLKAAGRDARGLSLLDLGIIGDSALIVRTVVENSIVLAPFTRAMQRAIIGRRLDIADHLLPHLTTTPWNDSFELNILAGLAGQNGFLMLEDELGKVVLSEPEPQDAVDCLDTLGLQLDSDELVIPGSASFDSSDVPDWIPPPNFSDTQNIFGNSEYDTSESFQTVDPDGTHHFSYWQLYPPS